MTSRLRAIALPLLWPYPELELNDALSPLYSHVNRDIYSLFVIGISVQGFRIGHGSCFIICSGFVIIFSG